MPNLTSTSYYRLSQFDLDGTIEIFSDKIIELSCNSNDDQSIQVYPNPNNGNFTVKFLSNNHVALSGEMQIFSIGGTLVYQKDLSIDSGIHLFAINENLSKGLYIVNVSLNGESYVPERFIVK
jgi:hypothetical protein